MCKLDNISLPDCKSLPRSVIVLEVLDAIAAVTFLAGSIYFLPCYAKDAHAFIVGCRLFLVGSYMLLAVSSIALVETLMKRCLTFEVWADGLYFLGSVSFVIGRFLYMPDEDHYAPLVRFWRKHRVMERTATLERLIDALPDDQVITDESASSVVHKARELERTGIGRYVNFYNRECLGTVLFMVGSCLFAFAAFTNALRQQQFNKWTSRMFTAATTMYMAGALQYIMGSMCFLPQIVASDEVAAMGAWLFIGGSSCFIVGSVLSLWRTAVLYRGDAEESNVLNRIS